MYKLKCDNSILYTVDACMHGRLSCRPGRPALAARDIWNPIHIPWIAPGFGGRADRARRHIIMHGSEQTLSLAAGRPAAALAVGRTSSPRARSASCGRPELSSPVRPPARSTSSAVAVRQHAGMALAAQRRSPSIPLVLASL